MFGFEGSIVEEGLMLLHSGVKRSIILLGPSTEWVQQEDWVLVTELQELFSGVLEEENVTVVEWISDLEGVDGISISFSDLLVYQFVFR